MDTNTFSDVTWMPCLGRDLNLGDLYDCCTDKKAIGSSIWDEKAIHEAQIECICPGKGDAIECTDFVLHNNDKKASCLGIGGELYLSCAAGHIRLGAEAGLFNDNVVSKHILRVALKCYSSSKTIQLNKSKINSWDIGTFEQEGATHVVTGTLYGAISIVVCDQKIQDKHDIKATYKNLKTKINYLQRCVSGNRPEVFSNIESSSENITCKVFSTIHITHKIETYADAIRFCEGLYKLHANSAHVPISVSLFPLQRINKAFTKNARNINDIDLINQVKSMHDTITDIGLHLMDLQTNMGSNLTCIAEQIESYKVAILDLRSEFTKIVGNIVPRYRRNELEKPVLIEKIKATIDKLQNLSALVQRKLKELQQINVFMKAIKDYDLISEDSDVYFKYRYIICLEFNSSYLIDCTLSADVLPWYQDKKIIAEVRFKIKQFLKFAKENMDEGIKFAVSEFSDKGCGELVVIRLCYDNKTLLFEPPTPPSKPRESQKTESSITLVWSKPEYGAQFITSYQIYFSRANVDRWTAGPTIESTNNEVTIENLEVNTGYLFKVFATLKIGTTIESQVSEAIHTAEISETKPGKKNDSSKSTKPKDTFPDNLGKVSKSKTNTAHSSNKGASTTPNQTQCTKVSDIKKTPQESKLLSQNATNRVSGKGNAKIHAAHKPIKNVETKGSTIKRFHEANKCAQLTAGSQCIYKLTITPSRENVRCTDVELFNFGGRNHELIEKVILLVGATGAGKSTLINGIVNYIFGVDWEDSERALLIESSINKKGGTQALSQTKSVQVYKINHSKHDQLSYNLTLIDTPGFEDADGLSKDETIMTKIKSLLTSDKVIDHIDGICFVVQAPLSRLTPTQAYVINSVYSLFGNDVANNIFVLATFSDPVSAPHVQSALDEAKILFNKMFKFNNSALYASTSRQDDKHSLNKLLWKMGMESFSTFFRELETVDPVSLTLTKDVLNERKKLQIILEGLKTQIDRKFLNMQKLEHEEEMLTKHKNEAEKNENFQYQELIVHNELVQLDSKFQLATNCRRCERTCHSDCRESRQTKRCMLMVSSSLFAIGDYICSLCKCPMKQHSISNSVYCIYTGTETITIKDKKQKYDKATTAQINVEKIIQKITTELENVRKVTRENLSEMHSCIQQINEISLQPNLTTEADYVSTLIASENAEQTKGYTTRLNFYQKILKELQNSDNSSEV